jgi:hypothetical protein
MTTVRRPMGPPPPRSPVDRFVRDPLQDLAHPPRGQVPALDVLRALAVLLVILVHTTCSSC